MRTILVLLGLFLLAAAAVFSLRRDKKQGKPGCGGSCASCGACHRCEAGAKDKPAG